MTDEKPLRVSDLEFREITRDASPALLQFLREKEAVHPLEDDEQLYNNRLAPSHPPDDKLVWDKHCYGLFVPGKETPELFVYAKLSSIDAGENGHIENNQIPAKIKSILGHEVKPIVDPNTVVFYSITSANAHIKRDTGKNGAAEELIHRAAEHLMGIGVTNYTTLSPLRRGTGEEAAKQGFTAWLQDALNNSESPILTPIEKKRLHSLNQTARGMVNLSPWEAIEHAHRHFVDLNGTEKTFISELMKDLAVTYLVEAKAPESQRIVQDKVGQFHLANGAEIAAVHYHPPYECTANDDAGALGMMLNYRYHPGERITKRKEDYRTKGDIAIDPVLEARHLSRKAQLVAPQKYDVTPIGRTETLVYQSPGPDLT